jgi:hypothetical protein
MMFKGKGLKPVAFKLWAAEFNLHRPTWRISFSSASVGWMICLVTNGSIMCRPSCTSRKSHVAGPASADSDS